jgi:uncharacterized protein with FMN-binding domain
MPPPARSPSLARRLLPALALTGVSGILIALLDHPNGSTAIGTTSPSTTASPAGTRAPVVRPTGSQQPPAFPVPTTAPAAPAGGSGSCTGSTVDGPAVDTRWGPVQVAVTVAADGRLCDVEALEYPNDNRKSSSINQRALPVLHTRVLAQGANFDAVSGATVTSEGYRSSLQAVLDH